LPECKEKLKNPNEGARIIRARSVSGFWVGCFPQDFSHFAIAGGLHKSRI